MFTWHRAFEQDRDTSTGSMYFRVTEQHHNLLVCAYVRMSIYLVVKEVWIRSTSKRLSHFKGILRIPNHTCSQCTPLDVLKDVGHLRICREMAGLHWHRGLVWRLTEAYC
jgi:hypothetical protein